MFSAFVPVWMAMPCFSKLRCSTRATSSSSAGTTCGITSIRVTWLPNALRKYANSTPIAPAPMIATEAGGRARGTSASREVMMRSPSTGRSGRRRGLATRGKQHILRPEELPLVLARGDFDHARHGDLPAADEVIHLVFAKEKLDTLGHLVGHRAGALHDLREVERHALDAKAERFRVPDLQVELGALQQRL